MGTFKSRLSFGISEGAPSKFRDWRSLFQSGDSKSVSNFSKKGPEGQRKNSSSNTPGPLGHVLLLLWLFEGLAGEQNDNKIESVK